jgi:hypothetical protein
MRRAATIGILVIIFFIIEWMGRDQQYAIANLGFKFYRPVRWAIYFTIVLAIINFAGNEQQFIYFQF